MTKLLSGIFLTVSVGPFVYCFLHLKCPTVQIIQKCEVTSYKSCQSREEETKSISLKNVALEVEK